MQGTGFRNPEKPALLSPPIKRRLGGARSVRSSAPRWLYQVCCAMAFNLESAQLITSAASVAALEALNKSAACAVRSSGSTTSTLREEKSLRHPYVGCWELRAEAQCRVCGHRYQLLHTTGGLSSGIAGHGYFLSDGPSRFQPPSMPIFWLPHWSRTCMHWYPSCPTDLSCRCIRERSLLGAEGDDSIMTGRLFCNSGEHRR
jgi:hypothetical protein